MVTSILLTKSPKQVAELADQLKALGDATRLELILAVATSIGAEACVCDLTPDTGLTQGTVSHHLRLLVEAGLLQRELRGKWSYYSLTKASIGLLSSLGLTGTTGPKKQKSC
jgi:ArsR family transcriptional regulator